MVSGKQNIGPLELKAEVIGGVPRREQGLEGPAVAVEPVTVLEGNVGDEILLHILTPRGAGALASGLACLVPVACRLGTGCRDQRRQSVDVVVVRMGDEDVRD